VRGNSLAQFLGGNGGVSLPLYRVQQLCCWKDFVMGNRLTKLENKQKREREKDEPRVQRERERWKKDSSEKEFTYESNRTQIREVYNKVKEVALRIHAVSSSRNSLQEIRVKVSPDSHSLEILDLICRRSITIKPCKGGSFRIDYKEGDGSAFLFFNQSYIKISSVTEDTIVSWVRWVKTGKRFSGKTVLTAIIIFFLLLSLLGIIIGVHTD